MIQAFYKSKPEQDTPYRQLSVSHTDGWRVRLITGMKWGREDAEELKVINAESFDAAHRIFDRLYKELQAEGWRPYSPYEPW
jgi:hypothetical protein